MLILFDFDISVNSENVICVCVCVSDPLREKLKHAYTAGVQSLVTHLGAGVTKGTILHSAAVWVKNQLLTSTLNVKR